jgi:hypothetical protein
MVHSGAMGWLSDLLRGGSGELGWDNLTTKLKERCLRLFAKGCFQNQHSMHSFEQLGAIQRLNGYRQQRFFSE